MGHEVYDESTRRNVDTNLTSRLRDGPSPSRTTGEVQDCAGPGAGRPARELSGRGRARRPRGDASMSRRQQQQGSAPGGRGAYGAGGSAGGRCQLWPGAAALVLVVCGTAATHGFVAVPQASSCKGTAVPLRMRTVPPPLRLASGAGLSRAAPRRAGVPPRRARSRRRAARIAGAGRRRSSRSNISATRAS